MLSAAAPPITTESAEVSDVKDFQRIQQLPLNGRQISQLFVLTPGVEGEAGGSNAPRVNGLKVGSVEIRWTAYQLLIALAAGCGRLSQVWTPSPSSESRQWVRMLAIRVRRQ